jgi:hypothetical protein
MFSLDLWASECSCMNGSRNSEMLFCYKLNREVMKHTTACACKACMCVCLYLCVSAFFCEGDL